MRRRLSFYFNALLKRGFTWGQPGGSRSSLLSNGLTAENVALQRYKLVAPRSPAPPAPVFSAPMGPSPQVKDTCAYRFTQAAPRQTAVRVKAGGRRCRRTWGELLEASSARVNQLDGAARQQTSGRIVRTARPLR